MAFLFIELSCLLPFSILSWNQVFFFLDKLWFIPFVCTLIQILTNLKESFWPFQQNQSRSLFLRAADAANCSDSSDAFEERYFNYLNLQHSLLWENWEVIYTYIRLPCITKFTIYYSLLHLPLFQLVHVDMCINISVFVHFCLFSSGFQLASAKAAQHRLERGVWTSVRYGDMRRALSGNVKFFFFELVRPQSIY